MMLETLLAILIFAAILNIAWFIWLTIAIKDIRMSLRQIRFNSNASMFRIDRMSSDEFTAKNEGWGTSCGICELSAGAGRPVAYVRRHGEPIRICLECAEKEHRDALREWDREAEEAAVEKLCAEAGVRKPGIS